MFTVFRDSSSFIGILLRPSLMKRIFQIAGVALNGIARPGDVEKALEEMETVDSVEYHRIFGLLHNVNKELDLFSKFGIDKIFELRILSVDSKYRGRGLAKELFLRSEVIAEEYGLKVSFHKIKKKHSTAKNNTLTF